MRFVTSIVLCSLVSLGAGCGGVSETTTIAVDQGPWFKGGFDEALAKAASDKKPVMIDFWASWCGPCVRMNNEVFPDASVQRELGRMVSLKVDSDAEVGQKLGARYKVTALPTMLFLNGKGEEIGRLVGFQSIDAFKDQAQAAIARQRDA